jgi:hypothetical protein
MAQTIQGWIRSDTTHKQALKNQWRNDRINKRIERKKHRGGYAPKKKGWIREGDLRGITTDNSTVYSNPYIQTDRQTGHGGAKLGEPHGVTASFQANVYRCSLN